MSCQAPERPYIARGHVVGRSMPEPVQALPDSGPANARIPSVTPKSCSTHMPAPCALCRPLQAEVVPPVAPTLPRPSEPAPTPQLFPGPDGPSWPPKRAFAAVALDNLLDSVVDIGRHVRRMNAVENPNVLPSPGQEQLVPGAARGRGGRAAAIDRTQLYGKVPHPCNRAYYRLKGEIWCIAARAARWSWSYCRRVVRLRLVPWMPHAPRKHAFVPTMLRGRCR